MHGYKDVCMICHEEIVYIALGYTVIAINVNYDLELKIFLLAPTCNDALR